MSSYRRRTAAALVCVMTATLIGAVEATPAAAGPSTPLESTRSVPVTQQTMGGRAPDQASLQALTGNQPSGGEVSDGAGTPSASPLSPSASWQVSAHTGDFTWSYPLRVPPAPGGLEPRLELSYSSSAVDGRTSATNNQASWVGDGWDLSVGFIERTYGACSADGHQAKGDLCWRTDNAFAAFAGGSGQMAKDANGYWRLEHDNGSRIERLTGAANGARDGEHWKVTTVDGTQYFFGSRADAASTWTVPVFGDDAGEPCHTGTFTTSHCVQAWRWNLDRVVDTHGNQIRYGYHAESGTYKRNEGEAAAGYTRGGTLRAAEYGPADSAGRTSGRVDFETAERCVPGSTCTNRREHWPNWPDSSWESEGESVSPAFWIQKRLSKVTTHVLAGGTYRPVDSWTLEHSFPNPGDGEKAALWLRSITHTGHAGGEITLPPVVFEGTKMANRVHLPDVFAPLNRYRITGIVSESGGVTDIKYRAPDCTPSNVSSIVAHENTRLCYPVKWQPQYNAERTDYFHKYVVESVEELDRLGTTVPDSTRYEYHDGAAWHYDTSEFTEDSKRTWNEYRGFGRVRVLSGRDDDPSGPVTMQEHRYHRGMHGDTLPHGATRSVTVDGRPDHDWLAGFEHYEATHLGVGDTIVTKTHTRPGWQGPTATRGKLSTHIVRPEEVRVLTSLGSDAWRETRVTSSYDDRGILIETNDLGDVGTAEDDKCTTVTHARNTAAWIIDRPSRTVVVSVDCDKTPVFPRDALSDTRTAYDGKGFGEAPAQGEATHVQAVKVRPAAGPAYQSVSTTEYDQYGRAVRMADALGRVTTMAFEPATGGPVTKTTSTNPLGHGTTTTLDPAWGLPALTVDANRAKTETAYDALGRIAQVWLPNRPRATYPEGSAKFTYEIRNNDTTVVTTSRVGPRGNHVTFHTIYDGLLRVRQTQSPAVGGGRLIADTRYDTQGRAYKTTHPYYNEADLDKNLWSALDSGIPGLTRHTYDGANRVVATELRVNDEVAQRTTRSYSGDRINVTPPPGAPATTTILDAQGRAVELIQAGERTRYTYGPDGKLSSVTDPAGNVWRHEYDLRGNRIRSVDVDKGTSTTTFDAAGQVTSTTDARGVTLTYEYDPLGRRTGVKQGESMLAEWTYDTAFNGIGLPAKTIRYHAGQQYVGEVMGYSLMKQVTRSQITIPETEQSLAGTYVSMFRYNFDGSLASETFPAIGNLKQETVTHTYDDSGRPLKTYGGTAGSPVNYALDTEFTRYGEATRLHLGEGDKRAWVTTYRQEGTRRLERMVVDTETPSPKQSDTSLAYDPAGNITSIVSQGADETVDRQCFRYDTQRRLTDAWTPVGECASPAATLGGPAPYRQSFTYDAAGNRLSEDRDGVVRQYHYPEGGHKLASLTAPASAAETFGYDATGNLTSVDGMTLEWNAEGHLARAVKDGRETTFVYSATGTRLLRSDPDSVTLYLAGQELQLDKVSGSRRATRYYTHGDKTIAVRANDQRLIWLAGDHQDTPMVAIDAESRQVTRRYFDPFGSLRGQQPEFPGDKGFVGGTDDGSTGLTHLGARAYAPELGRFISVDPILTAGDPQQLNGYAYAKNTPVTLSDPTGMLPGIFGAILNVAKNVVTWAAKALGGAVSRLITRAVKAISTAVATVARKTQQLAASYPQRKGTVRDAVRAVMNQVPIPEVSICFPWALGCKEQQKNLQRYYRESLIAMVCGNARPGWCDLPSPDYLTFEVGGSVKVFGLSGLVTVTRTGRVYMAPEGSIGHGAADVSATTHAGWVFRPDMTRASDDEVSGYPAEWATGGRVRPFPLGGGSHQMHAVGFSTASGLYAAEVGVTTEIINVSKSYGFQVADKGRLW